MWHCDGDSDQFKDFTQSFHFVLRGELFSSYHQQIENAVDKEPTHLMEKTGVMPPIPAHWIIRVRGLISGETKYFPNLQ